MSKKEASISVPHYPPYGEVRYLLQIWEGKTRKQITGLRQAIENLTGTPQCIVVWKNPEEWISKRLNGENRKLAKAIWQKSNKTCNPRYTFGHWSLIQKYGLLCEGTDDKLQITRDGRKFLSSSGGEVVQRLDRQEGLTALLSMIKVNEPTRRNGIEGDWTHHLERYSNFRRLATFRTALQSRINNLLERDLIKRDGGKYSLTRKGSTYLEKSGSEKDADSDITLKIREWLNNTREDILKRLRNMDPREFEYLVKELLDKMGYENVEVTKSSRDGGVDVTASIEVGITSVKEVIQVKRHNKTIPPKEVDALRGSLSRFDAIRGTLITTSGFSKKTKDDARVGKAQPITLIDGEKLVELMIEHEIGARKHIVYSPDPFPELEIDE